MHRSLLCLLLIAVGTPLLAAQEAVDFARDIRPLLAKHCLACHGPDEAAREGGLRLDQRAEALKVIAAGDALASELWQRVTSADEEERMPPSEHAPRLEQEELELLRRWMEGGAPFAKHWAFSEPERRELPTAATGTAIDPLDKWIDASITAAGLTANGAEDPRVLLRRLSLDLTGLPPTPEDLARFVAAPTEAAYEREVDRLLAAPAYAERWASEWLDLARYADSAGFGSDPLRTIWRYRDWVIEAIEHNMPYDQFGIEQLAGDLFAEPTVEQRLATAFHRNTLTNTEGGTDDEEFRVAAVKDRANTTFQVWMGLTLGCAQCHSHKFDPISHQEYYQVYAFFNQTADRDRPDEAPLLDTPSRTEFEERRIIARELESLQTAIAAHAATQPPWTPLEFDAIEGERGTLYEREGLSGFRATGALVDTERTRIQRQARTGGFGALRLELKTCDETGALSRDTSNGNIVLSEVTIAARPSSRQPPEIERVRVQLPGLQRILHFAEVQIFSAGENVALRGSAQQSSTGFGGDAKRAIDGRTTGVYDEGSCTHCAAEDDPWWELKLDRSVPLDRLVLWNRTDGDLERRLDGVRIEAFDASGTVVWSTVIERASAASLSFEPGTAFTPLDLRSARADFEQHEWPASAAIDGDERTGWAVAPRQREAHTIEFEVDAEHLRTQEHDFEITLAQMYGGSHVVARAELFVREPLPASVRGLQERERTLKSRLATMPSTRTPVMQELDPQHQRVTRILDKGNFLTPGSEVVAAVPAAFHPYGVDFPLNRWGLAQWIFDERNPLTARVAVNRYWSRLFGRGLVESEEDFGVQGSLPTHPELLDLLSLDFMAHGWDVKALLKRMVMSATYRRSSVVRPEVEAADPRNLLYARGPRFRLSAEMVRDQALAVADLLSSKRFGPSVFPPQPDGLWQAAFNGERTWRTSTGEDRYRRGLYTFLRRTIPYPSMAIFDAPSRELCTARRLRTNTPLQALVTWNDPVFVEARDALAARMQNAPLATEDERIQFGYELCTATRADREELQVLRDLLASRRVSNPNDETAAWRSVAAVLLNLEATLVKR